MQYSTPGYIKNLGAKKYSNSRSRSSSKVYSSSSMCVDVACIVVHAVNAGFRDGIKNANSRARQEVAALSFPLSLVCPAAAGGGQSLQDTLTHSSSSSSSSKHLDGISRLS